MRIILLLAVLGLLSCSDADRSAPRLPDASAANHDPKQYSLLNDQMVYNHRFAELFSLDPAKAIELDPGVLAIRIYWTVFANRDFAYALYEPDEYRNKLPATQIQLFLEDDIPVHLSKQEGTLYNFESFVRSGFLFFNHSSPKLPESFNKENYSEFFYRLILSSENEDGAMSSTISRYKRTLVPGVTALEFDGGSYKKPFVIYVYIGKEPASPKIEVPQLRRVARSIDDYDSSQFLRIRIPDELAPVLKQPYRKE